MLGRFSRTNTDDPARLAWTRQVRVGFHQRRDPVAHRFRHRCRTHRRHVHVHEHDLGGRGQGAIGLPVQVLEVMQAFAIEIQQLAGDAIGIAFCQLARLRHV